MKRFGLYLLGLMFLAGCTAQPVSSTRYVDSIYNVTHLQQSTVTIVQRRADGRLSGPHCTAFYISPRRLATAEHCVEDNNVQTIQLAPGLTIQITNGEEAEPTLGREILFIDWAATNRTIDNFDPNQDPEPIRSRVIALDPDNDIAILELAYNEDDSEHWLPMATGAQVGQRLYSMGMPRNQIWLLSEGMISSIRRYPDGRERLLYQGIVAPGASGSPLINNHGRVIGVVVQYVRDVPGVGVASPVSALEALVEQGEQTAIEFTADEVRNIMAERKPEPCDPGTSSCPMPETEQ